MISRRTVMMAILLAGASPIHIGRASAAEQPQEGPRREQPPKDPQSTFEPRSAPGAGQKLMEQFIGEWNVVKTISPPGKDPVITSGTCSQTMMHGGKFLRSEFLFHEKDGTDTNGLGILGYEAKTDLFTSVWTDSRSTRMSLRQSQGKFDGTRIMLHSKALEGNPEARKSHTIAQLEEGGRKLVHRQYNPGPDGKEFVIMELMMTRQEPSKPTRKS